MCRLSLEKPTSSRSWTRVQFPPPPLVAEGPAMAGPSAFRETRENGADAVRAPDRDGDVPVHGHRGLHAAAAGARGGVRRRARGAPPRAARRVAAARRGRGRTRRATHSSSRSLARRTQSRPPRTRNARLRVARCVCGWACTRGRRAGSATTTSGSRCTGRRGSRPPGTAARCSCRSRPSISPARASRVRDLGLHRLKDLSAPERLFQLGAGVFPPAEDACTRRTCRSRRRRFSAASRRSRTSRRCSGVQTFGSSP